MAACAGSDLPADAMVQDVVASDCGGDAAVAGQVAQESDVKEQHVQAEFDAGAAGDPASNEATADAKEVGATSGEGTDDETGRLNKRKRVFQAATVFTGLVTGFVCVLLTRLTLGTGSLVWHGIAATLVMATTCTYILAKPWMTAFPPGTLEASKINLALIIMFSIGMSTLSMLSRVLDGDARRLMWIGMCLWIHFGIIGYLTIFRNRGKYGGIRMFFNSCFGIFIVFFEFTSFVMLLNPVLPENVANLNLMLNFAILVCVLMPYVLGLHPYLACSRRRFGEGKEATRERIQMDPCYTFLLSHQTSFLPFTAGSVFVAIFLALPLQPAVLVLIWQAFMALITLFFSYLARGGQPEFQDVPFRFIVELVSDGFLNLIFLNASASDPNLWLSLAVEFVFLIMRGADLWGDLIQVLTPKKKRSSADSMLNMIRVPEQVASIAVTTEFTSSLSIAVMVICELLMTEWEVGVPALTSGLTQSERTMTLAVFGIVVAMQLLALAVSHTIVRRKWRLASQQCQQGGDSVLEVTSVAAKMWQAHGLYFVVSSVLVVGSMVFYGVNVKLIMADKEPLMI